jgi:hypothetical protein
VTLEGAVHEVLRARLTRFSFQTHRCVAVDTMRQPGLHIISAEAMAMAARGMYAKLRERQ